MSSTPDYTSYTRTDLLKRIRDLETCLKDSKPQACAPTPIPSHTKRKDGQKVKTKTKKKGKSFDPSRYHHRLIALKFAYLGANYNGYEHHLNNTTPLPTVEEQLYRALRKTRLIFPDFSKRTSGLGHGQAEAEIETELETEEVCWEGTNYSKCGRTDRGVSAFGQVLGIRVRSLRPKRIVEEDTEGPQPASEDETLDNGCAEGWDSIRDEMPYIQILNRVLPPDIRILAWCPDPGEDFSARFNCKERRYRYFFTNPAYSMAPNVSEAREGLLDIAAMRVAAKKYEGLHDFRNLCKVDPSKQITNFARRIFHADIHEVDMNTAAPSGSASSLREPNLYYFEVRGSAFLWHQVRHLVAVLFLVGQKYEEPSIVDELLDIRKTPNKPLFDMASDKPLVLWDCIFPDPSKVVSQDHGLSPDGQTFHGYEDSLKWVYIGDSIVDRDSNKQNGTGVIDGKWERNGMMDDLWALWRRSKMDEVLASSLMKVVSHLGHSVDEVPVQVITGEDEQNDRIFDGSDKPKNVGTYVPLMQRARMETPEVVNARYAARRGLHPGQSIAQTDEA